MSCKNIYFIKNHHACSFQSSHYCSKVFEWRGGGHFLPTTQYYQSSGREFIFWEGWSYTSSHSFMFLNHPNSLNICHIYIILLFDTTISNIHSLKFDYMAKASVGMKVERGSTHSDPLTYMQALNTHLYCRVQSMIIKFGLNFCRCFYS